MHQDNLGTYVPEYDRERNDRIRQGVMRSDQRTPSAGFKSHEGLDAGPTA